METAVLEIEEFQTEDICGPISMIHANDCV